MMTSGTWHQSVGHTPRPVHVQIRAVAQRASRAIANWCAQHLTHPGHYRMGAFDATRSGLARDLLQRRHR
jgi:hypothetical protein